MRCLRRRGAEQSPLIIALPTRSNGHISDEAHERGIDVIIPDNFKNWRMQWLKQKY